MKYLGITDTELIKKGAIHTAREIAQQPGLWVKIFEQVQFEQSTIQKFFSDIAGFERVILTGAGTSAFIGMSLRGVFQRKLNKVVEAISTTDLVTHPRDFFSPKIPTLMISFARSGNSPESVAAVKLADEFCESCAHLVITCNGEGSLANHSFKGNRYIFTLPREANDLSLAMTSSYSGMLLTGKLIAHINGLKEIQRSVETIVRYGEKSINYFSADVEALAGRDFKRAVFLGAGPQYGTATEAHLKLQELTDGKVICKNDSFLGLRHGPKAVIDETTLVVYFMSNDSYAQQYERDLIKATSKGRHPLAEILIAERAVSDVRVDHQFIFSENGNHVDEEFLAVSNIVMAQLLGFYKSLNLGLKPDAPSDSGAISRVVEGVNIYSVH